MPTQVPTYYEHSEEIGSTPFTITNPDGSTETFSRPVIKKMTVPGEPVTVDGFVPVYSIETTSGDSKSGGKIDYSQTFQKASPP
jgi:hypothetical protein